MTTWLLHDLWIALVFLALVPLLVRAYDALERWGAPDEEELGADA